MRGFRWVVAGLAGLSGGYMLFDGLRALIVGDYLTPSSGEHAGQLGPWANLVSAVGIEPRSPFMKWFFVGYGSAWLGVTVAFVFRASWAWAAMVAFAAGSLWYLIPGTALSALQLGFLLWQRFRG